MITVDPRRRRPDVRTSEARLELTSEATWGMIAFATLPVIDGESAQCAPRGRRRAGRPKAIRGIRVDVEHDRRTAA